MEIKAVFEIIAKNPPSILIARGLIGLLMCGLTQIDVFCDNWLLLIIIGALLQAGWLMNGN